MSKQIEEVMALVDEFGDFESPKTGEQAMQKRESIEAKLRELLPVWQPISMAPKNTDVLVLARNSQYVALLVDDASDPWFEEGSAESDFNGLWTVTDNKHGPYALRGGNPTHWMPLPKALE